MTRFLYTAGAALLLTGLAVAQQKADKPNGKTQRIGGHPDLSGTWTFAIDLAPGALKKQVGGSASVVRVDSKIRNANRPASGLVPGALPSTPVPSYKPEFQAKVKFLDENESKVDPVFYCGKPGIPRIGPPRRIVQFPNEMIFLYEDAAGDPYRIIPTDGRPHRADANPSYYGDSVGRWEGDTLVVDVKSFVEETWFGEKGYLHSAAMHVIERFWRNGEDLIYQVTVEDPNVLSQPWTMPARVVKPSDEILEESPACKEDDGHRLLNLDHHQQR